MSKHCYKCSAVMPHEAVTCPRCGAKARFYGEMKYRIEHNKLYMALTVIVALLLLGLAWLIRMSTGMKWPLYVVIVALAPLVPWILEHAYMAADPVKTPEETTEQQFLHEKDQD